MKDQAWELIRAHSRNSPGRHLDTQTKFRKKLSYPFVGSVLNVITDNSKKRKIPGPKEEKNFPQVN